MMGRGETAAAVLVVFAIIALYGWMFWVGSQNRLAQADQREQQCIASLAAGMKPEQLPLCFPNAAKAVAQ